MHSESFEMMPINEAPSNPCPYLKTRIQRQKLMRHVRGSILKNIEYFKMESQDTLPTLKKQNLDGLLLPKNFTIT
jgi:hypothetical protein